MESPISLPESPAPPAFKDRRTTLIVGGILQLLIGALCALLVPLLLFGQAMSSRLAGAEVQYRLILPAVAVYGALAAIFVFLGIGSIRERRWARALSLILAWSWLVVGVLSLVIYSFMVPKLLMAGAPGVPALPESAKVIMVVLAIATMGFFFVLVPGGLVLMYQSKHVKATCEARDPALCWTDRCPLPVLTLSFWLFFGGLSMLMMPIAYHGVAPFFGRLISGFPGTLFYGGFAVLFLVLALGIYRLNLTAWWITLASTILFAVSSVWTFARVELTEMYQLMGYPEAQLRQLEQFGTLQHSIMLWTALGFLPFFAYLFFLRKYFRPLPAADLPLPDQPQTPLN